MTDNEKLLLTIIAFPATLLATVLLYLWNAHWYQDVWNWYIPTYFNIAPISFYQMLGLSFVGGIFARPSSSKKDEGIAEFLSYFLTLFFGPMVLWAVAWFFKDKILGG